MIDEKNSAFRDSTDYRQKFLPAPIFLLVPKNFFSPKLITYVNLDQNSFGPKFRIRIQIQCIWIHWLWVYFPASLPTTSINSFFLIQYRYFLIMIIMLFCCLIRYYYITCIKNGYLCEIVLCTVSCEQKDTSNLQFFKNTTFLNFRKRM